MPSRTPEPSRQQRRFLHTGSKQWRSIRQAQLEREPLCRHCGAPATEVDHIDGDDANNLLDNLQSLDKSCHSVKTQADEYYKRTGIRQPIKGSDVYGWPRDPHHHWNIANRSRKSPAR